MSRFSDRCTQTQALRFLESVTLTVSQHITDRIGWAKSVLALLSSSPLKKFHIYSTHITPAGVLTNSEPGLDIINAIGMGPYTLANVLALFYRDLAAAHGQTLARFSVLRMPITLVSIRAICEGCPNLEELFVVADSSSLHDLPDALAPAKKLRTVHVNFPVRNAPASNDSEEESESELELELEDGVREQIARSTMVLPTEALQVVKRCTPTLTQFGCNTRVWKVRTCVYAEIPF